jgi:hypothetical protein
MSRLTGLDSKTASVALVSSTGQLLYSTTGLLAGRGVLPGHGPAAKRLALRVCCLAVLQVMSLYVFDYLQHIQCGDNADQRVAAGHENTMNLALDHGRSNVLHTVFLAHLEDHRGHDFAYLDR